MPFAITRRSALLRAAAAFALQLGAGCFAPSRANPSAQPVRIPPYAGINLAGAEFGDLLGHHGTEYLYPTRQNVDYYAQLGFNVIRLPFRWERLQLQNQGAFALAEQARLVDIVHYTTGQGIAVILDPHNFAKRRFPDDAWRTEHLIGSAKVPIAAFADFWSKLATLFKTDQRVMFGLMNEPVDIKVPDWLAAVNASIAAIRATGATNLILVPGVDYTGAHSWHRAGNTAMAGVVDPANNFAFDVHQYFDTDSSGTHVESVSGTIGSERIEAFQEWARAHRFKAFLGEFDGGRNQTSYNALADICQEMNANPDVWIGWTAWAGGPRWPDDDMYNLEPYAGSGREREQTSILKAYAQPRDAPLWIAPGSAIDLDFARDRFFGVEGAGAALQVERAWTGSARKRNGTLQSFGPDNLRRTDLGVLIEPEGARGNAPERVRAGGALLDLLKRPDFSLVMEVRKLPAQPMPCGLLASDGRTLLQRRVDGAIETEWGARLATSAQPIVQWEAKRRVAISVRRNPGHVVIGATGVPAVSSDASVPDIGSVLIGSSQHATLNGYVARITAYPDFKDTSAINALVA